MEQGIPRVLTHTEVKLVLISFLEKQGWKSIKDQRRKIFKLVFRQSMKELTFESFNPHPDAVFEKDGSLFAMEIKPEYVTLGEIQRGIGQCALLLACPEYKPYLVISENWYGELVSVFIRLNWLGVITYKGKQMRIAQELCSTGVIIREEEAHTHKCQRCSYTWKSSLMQPKVCPKCKSYDWQEKKQEELVCKRCGHRWVPNLDIVLRCPHCRSRYWNAITVEEWNLKYGDLTKAILNRLDNPEE